MNLKAHCPQPGCGKKIERMEGPYSVCECGWRGQYPEMLNEYEAALKLLRRLRAYTLPKSAIEKARDIVQTLLLLPAGASPPGRIASNLRRLEQELIDLGGKHDAELEVTLTQMREFFPEARLVDNETKKREE